MISRRLIALLGSAALHVAAIAGALALVGILRPPQPLFVDLTREAQGGAVRAAAPPRGRESAARPTGTTSRVSAGTSRAPARPAPARPDEAMPGPAPAFSTSHEAAADQDAPSPSGLAPGGTTGGVASDAPASTGQPSGAANGALLALADPGPGRGEAPPEFGPYLARFRQQIQELVVYPLAARRRGLAGRVEVELLLEPSGRVRDVAVVTSSSHELLDEAAVEAVRALQPLPLPEHLPRRTLRVRLPVIFELR
jgi:TonB family protein